MYHVYNINNVNKKLKYTEFKNVSEEQHIYCFFTICKSLLHEYDLLNGSNNVLREIYILINMMKMKFE